MVMKGKEFKAAAQDAALRVRDAGAKAAARTVSAVDAALIDVGRAAKRRARQRAVKATLKAVGKAALVAGAAAATAMAARAVMKRRKALAG